MTTRTPDDDARKKPRSPQWRTEGVQGGDDKPGDGRTAAVPAPLRSVVLGGLLALLAINWVISNAFLGPEPRIRLPYTDFLVQLDQDNVASVTTQGDTIFGTLDTEIAAPDDPERTSERFETERPTFAEDDLLQRLIDQDVEVNAEPADQSAPLWQQLVFGFGPTLLLLWLLFSFYRRAGAGLAGVGGLGRSKAKLYVAAGKRTTFEDVAGIEDAENELVEIVDFLKEPEKYTRLGAASPAASCSAARPGPGRPSSPGRWPARPTCRSSRCPPRSSSR
jgi:cell division protease FtsH